MHKEGVHDVLMGLIFVVERRFAVQIPLQHFQRRIHLSDLVSFFGSSSLFLLNIFPENGFRI